MNLARKKRLRELAEPVSCAVCASGTNCWPVQAPAHAPDILVQRRPALARGELLWHQGSPFSGLYLVASGSLRLSETLPDGSEVVTGFAFPGDMVGFDGVAEDGTHACSATALEQSALCRVLWDPAAETDAQLPLEKKLLKRLAGQRRIMMSARPSRDAVDALARFLHRVRRRLGRIEGERCVVRLPMSRAEIANYLGLAEETVSRAFREIAGREQMLVAGRELSWPAAAAAAPSVTAPAVPGAPAPAS